MFSLDGECGVRSAGVYEVKDASGLQPVPYEPCHGRPDSQPAPPRLPPGCGSRSPSSPSAGAPPPPRTQDLTGGVKQQGARF